MSDPFYDKLLSIMVGRMTQASLDQRGKLYPRSQETIEKYARVFLDAIWSDIEGLRDDR